MAQGLRGHSRNRVALLLLTPLLTACVHSSDGYPPPAPASSTAPAVGSAGSYPVTKVTDGDTIHVTYRGADERVRLIGIDTPEVPWYGGKAGCYGVEAGLYARSRLDGRSVGLVFDTRLRDVYGRLLGYVYVGHELFNLTLVQHGYARADSVPPDTRMAATFAAAEREAKAAGRGLWSACPAS
jgi:micrococcal nuclease